MAHAFLNPTEYAREALRVLHNKLVFTRVIRRHYEKNFARPGRKIGYNLRVRKPNRFSVSEGAALNAQDITPEYETLTVDKQRHIDTSFTSAEYTMELDDWSRDIGAPAMSKLAAKVDFETMDMTEEIGNYVGTHGTTPATHLVLGQAKALLMDYGCPEDELVMCASPLMTATIQDALKALFNPQKTIGGDNIKGSLGRWNGFDWNTTAQVKNHTCGTYDANYDMNGAASEGGTSLTVDTGTGTVLKGDLFQIAGVNGTNPDNDQTLQHLFTFCCQTSQSDPATSIPVQLTMRSTGAYKTLGALPADGASLVFKGTASESYAYNVCFHPDAFTVAFIDLIKPRGVWCGSASKDGISIRVLETYIPDSDKPVMRMDVYFGFKTMYHELACLLPGASRT